MIKYNAKNISKMSSRKLKIEGHKEKVKIANLRFSIVSSGVILAGLFSLQFILACSNYSNSHPNRTLALLALCLPIEMVFMLRAANKQKTLGKAVARFIKNLDKYRRN